MGHETPLSLAQVALAGGTAGILSRVVVYPLDTIKTRLQVADRPGAWSKQSMRGLYSGFGSVLFFVVPGTTAYFTGFELGKYVFQNQGNAIQDFAAGIAAQLCCGLVFTPMDVLKEKRQAGALLSSQHNMPRTRDLVRTLGLKGLMHGYWLSSALWVPWSAAYATTYGQLKSWFEEPCLSRHSTEPQEPLPKVQMNPVSYALCAGMAAAVASALTHPIDVVKTRVQVLSGACGNRHLIPTGEAITSLWASEGLRGFWRGFGTRLGLMAPQTSISWMTYETVNKWLAEH